MIKELFTSLTGISEDWDSEENQEAWDLQRLEDESDGEEEEEDE